MDNNRFYTNKYPISCCVQKEDKWEALPAGYVFTIESVNGDFVDLKPITKIDGFVMASVSINVFKFAFVGSEYGE